MYIDSASDFFNYPRRRRPQAAAAVTGSAKYPTIKGNVYLYQATGEVIVVADISGLPHGTTPCEAREFGFHIHEGHACAGTASDPFADAEGHYNPHGCEHPQHAGDFPPLFESRGHAYMAFITDRFEVNDVIGRVVIVHSNPDDMVTQPSGNSGEMAACGVIVRT